MTDNSKDLMEKLVRVEALHHRYQGFQFHRGGQFASPHKGQGRILSLLKLQPEISQKELGYLLDMRNQSMGELLAKLERNGYITRFPLETDRRVMNIKLTAEGLAAAEQLDKQPESGGSIFDCLNQTEQAQLSDYLDRLIEALEKAFATIAGPEHGYDRLGFPHPGHGDRLGHQVHGQGDHGFDHPHHAFDQGGGRPAFNGIWDSPDPDGQPSRSDQDKNQ